ncbi:MAG: LLM class flavin-dependent oxidoreductase [Acidimicrobiia bacterium]|nr:LLM class flavin-dependent oxidoreductase [Acidimicrobiia bacterium]
MVMTMMRFNCIQPGLEPNEMADRYNAMLDMVQVLDELGGGFVSLEEHHGAENGWSSSPLTMAAAILSRTKNVSVSISALLVPLHDPLRIAEDIAVIDLMSKGRLTVIGGIGYRPSEYAAHGKSWEDRGKIMDECVDVMLKAWTGDPFEYRGTPVRVTPRSYTQPRPPFLLGGTSKPAARRAARFGLPVMWAAPVPEVEAYYYEKCAEYGTQGFAMAPPETFHHTFFAEDVDTAWAQMGPHLLHEATVYHSWQTSDIRSSAHSYASNVDELRAEGLYQIVSPAEAVEEAKAAGDFAMFSMHPLCGGMPIDLGWKQIDLLRNEILPALA